MIGSSWTSQLTTDDTYRIIPTRAERAGDMSAVGIVSGAIEDRPVVIKKVPAVYIVDEAIALVVNAVAGNLASVYEDVVF